MMEHDTSRHLVHPEGTCLACGASFEMSKPHWASLILWRCPECEGHLELEITCSVCHEVNIRQTGWRGVYGRWASPNRCDHCEKSDLGIHRTPPHWERPASYSGRGRWGLLAAMGGWILFGAQLGAAVGGLGFFVVCFMLGLDLRSYDTLLAVVAGFTASFGGWMMAHGFLPSHYRSDTITPDEAS